MREVGDALLDNVAGDGCEVAFGGAFFVGVGDDFGYAEGGRVEWCLRNETVGEGDPEEPGYAGREAEEEDVPVEAGRFAEGEFSALCDERGDVVVEVEEDCEQDGEGDRDEDIAQADVPEVDEPPSVCGWEEGFAGGQCGERDGGHLADVHEACEEDYGEGGAVVFDENSNVVLEERAGANEAAEVTHGEHEERDNDGKVERFV